MIYIVEIDPAARKELAALPRKVQRQVDRKIMTLAEHPRPRGCKQLEGKKNRGIWRVRSGDYRIIYKIKQKRLVVLIIMIRHRKDVYRNL